MNQGIIIIGLEREGEEIIQQLRSLLPGKGLTGWIVLLSGPGENGSERGVKKWDNGGGVSYLLISGRGLSELRDEFASRSDEFRNILSLHGRSFQSKGQEINSFRYLLLCPLGSPLAGLLREIAQLIQRFHQQVAPLPCQQEAVLILPALEAGYQEKGWAYALLKEINQLQTLHRAYRGEEEPLFDFIWLCDHASLHRLPLAFTLYLDDRLPRDFSTNAHHSILPKFLLGKGCCYSSLGTYNLVFAWQEMAQLLKNRLEVDILSLGPLKAPGLNTFRPHDLIDEFRDRHQAYKLEDKLSLLQGKRLEEESEYLLREFEQGGEAAIEDILSVIYRKAEILFAQARERIIAADIRAYREEIAEGLRKDAEELMDNPDKGPYVAYAYLKYLLGQEDFYAGLTEEPLPEKKDLYNLRTILVATVREQALSLLKADLDEIIERLPSLYGKYQTPDIFWTGMERSRLEILQDTEATIDLSQLSDEEQEKATALKGVREMVSRAIAEIDQLLGENIRWAELSRSLEALAREKAREKLYELKSLKEELGQAWDELEEHQQKGMPLIWGRRRYKRRLRELTRAYEACQAAYLEGKKALSCIITERKNFIFRQGLILELYDQLVAGAQEIRDKVQGFIRALDGHRQRALERMDQIKTALQDETVSFQVAKAQHVSFFYYGEEEIPKLLVELYQYLHRTPEPQWSRHYQKVEELLHSLEEFALGPFLKLKDLGIEEVLFKLGNYPEALAKMNSHCNPLAQMRNFASDHLATMLYLGVEDERYTRLRNLDALGVIQGGYQFYTTGQRHNISGLRLAHGFTLFALGNIRDLKQGYQRLLGQGEEKDALEAYEQLEDLIPEELEK